MITVIMVLHQGASLSHYLSDMMLGVPGRSIRDRGGRTEDGVNENNNGTVSRRGREGGREGGEGRGGEGRGGEGRGGRKGVRGGREGLREVGIGSKRRERGSDDARQGESISE